MITIKGQQFDVAAEPADFWGWVAEGRYDSEWNILERFLRPEDTFIDLGAWVGSHSLFASTIARRVYAVEPDPVAFKILEKNVQGLPIHICKAAIAGYRGAITLGSGFLGASTTRANKHEGAGIGPWVEAQTFEVDCTTLRDFIGYIPSGLVDVNRTFFIKMDVEGSEEDILQDFEFFEEHKPTVYLETHPFWWKHEQQTWEKIFKIASLYKNTYGLNMERVDLRSTTPRQVILTDR